MVDYKQKYLGLHSSIEEAIKAREHASNFYGFDITHGKEPISN